MNKNKIPKTFTSGNTCNEITFLPMAYNQTKTSNFDQLKINYESISTRAYASKKSINKHIILGFSLIMLLLSARYVIFDVNRLYNFHVKMSEKYYHSGDYPNMLYHLKEMVKLDPHDTKTYGDIAYYYFSLAITNKEKRSEYQKKSIDYLMEGLKNNRNTPYMWEEIGNFFLYSLKDSTMAIPFYEKAITFKDCKMASYHFLAAGYYKQKKYDKAIKTLESCVKKFPDDKKAIDKLLELKK